MKLFLSREGRRILGRGGFPGLQDSSLCQASLSLLQLRDFSLHQAPRRGESNSAVSGCYMFEVMGKCWSLFWTPVRQAHVILQGVHIFKVLSTNGTLPWLIPYMHTWNVFLQVSFLNNNFVTNQTQVAGAVFQFWDHGVNVTCKNISMICHLKKAQKMKKSFGLLKCPNTLKLKRSKTESVEGLSSDHAPTVDIFGQISFFQRMHNRLFKLNLQNKLFKQGKHSARKPPKLIIQQM